MQKLLIATGALLALLVIIGLSLPRYTRVEVRASIDANPGSVFALVNDLERGMAWSPLLDADPNARISYSGPQRGVGATMEWDGAVVGHGVQRITESEPHRRVAIVMNPGEDGESLHQFDIASTSDGTDIVWRFEADHGLRIIERYLGPIIDDIIRRDCEAGLTRLKQLAESLPRADFTGLDIEHIEVEPLDIAYLSTTSQPDAASLSNALGDAYFRILRFIDESGLSEAGAPLSIARGFSGSELRFDAAIPIEVDEDARPAGAAGIMLGRTYGGPAVRASHRGSYRDLNDTHLKIASYIAALGLERNGDAWESYVTDPGSVAESDLLTYVYYPVVR